MVAIGEYCNTHSVPPLDRGLRSIVVQQVGNLLRGGWPVEEIIPQSLSILSQFNLAQGHKLMTQLQRTMELADEERQYQKHKARKDADFVAPDVAVLLPGKTMPESRRNHPNNHKFEWDSSDSCRRCGGPPGVHVKRVAVVA
jgi:peptide subunit release factor 1 (eRF1)